MPPNLRCTPARTDQRAGFPTYDFFMGRELNPRVLGGTLDLKFFCELRPGLMGWAVLNAAFALKQYEQLGFLTNSMILVLLFETYYVVDSFWFERCILTTMDITTDGFGFMLAFGDLAWVPLLYSLQARYLASHPLELPVWGVIAIVALQLAGLYIFRSSNLQKDTFRTQPNDPSVEREWPNTRRRSSKSAHTAVTMFYSLCADLTFLKTSRGTRLITNGWWGMARHINYLGDWLMSVAWCLPTGFATPITYFYAVYFAVLLIHRERRDDHKCSTKYGKDWQTYREMVPSRIVPGVY